MGELIQLPADASTTRGVLVFPSDGVQATCRAETVPGPEADVVKAARLFLHIAALTPEARLTVGQLCRLLYWAEGFMLALKSESL